eukprot:UN25321
MFQKGEDSDFFLKTQIQRAVANGDTTRQITLEVKMRDKFFANSQTLNMFDIKAFPGLKDDEDWSRERVMGIFKSIADTMLKWTKDPIHATLTEVDKKLRKEGAANIQNIQYYCSDKPCPGTNVEECGLKVLCLGFKCKELRDEIYCQLIKQTRENPQEYSLSQCWKLINLCL